METVAVVAHSGKTLQGGLGALRDALASAGVVDPLWFEVPKSRMATSGRGSGGLKAPGR